MPVSIKILGGRCGSCRRLEQNVHAALGESHFTATVEKIQDIDQLITYRVARIPALVIDETVLSQGRVLSVAEIRRILEEKSAVT